MPVARLAEWMAEPSTRQIRLPLGRSAARELTLVVWRQRGVAVVARDGQGEAGGVLPGAPAGAGPRRRRRPRRPPVRGGPEPAPGPLSKPSHLRLGGPAPPPA